MQLIRIGLIIIIVQFIEPILTDIPSLPVPSKLDKKTTKLPPCKLCTALIDSFKKGLERTGRSKFDGGDAAWEEINLGSYKRSEIRLIEIQEKLCLDVKRSEDQCHALAEENEHLIEEWWFKQQDEHPDIHKWLCIEKLEQCCEPNHFGPNCLACDNCNGNGNCKGNGTRKGNGKCACDTGYTGEFCMNCDTEYYEAFRDSEKLLCSRCHDSCDPTAGCTLAGPKGCRVCKNGWLMKPDLGGCIDIDECATTKHTCSKNQFCVNSLGSYKCLECDKTCNGCDGDGPDMCKTCATGYELRDNICTDTSKEKRDNYVSLTRYLTYFGLCICTCVIFKSSTWIASAVGLTVACYISLSEYWLRTNSQQQTNTDHNPFQDLLKG